MAHFIGYVDGNRGEASRLGSKDSGLRTTAASWQGSVRTYLYHNEATGRDHARVTLEPWRGSGCAATIYDGPVGEFKPLPLACVG